jgi:hypothetical protein
MAKRKKIEFCKSYAVLVDAYLLIEPDYIRHLHPISRTQEELKDDF